MSGPTASLPYGQVLRLDELLQAARVHDDDVDHVLFLATHQSCEIYFAVLLRHLEAVRAALDARDGALAVRRAAPLPVLVATLVRQFDGLATLTPRRSTPCGTRSGTPAAFSPPSTARSSTSAACATRASSTPRASPKPTANGCGHGWTSAPSRRRTATSPPTARTGSPSRAYAARCSTSTKPSPSGGRATRCSPNGSSAAAPGPRGPTAPRTCGAPPAGAWCPTSGRAERKRRKARPSAVTEMLSAPAAARLA